MVIETKPFDAAAYLDTNEEIAVYLEAALEDSEQHMATGGGWQLAFAVKDAVRALRKRAVRGKHNFQVHWSGDYVEYIGTCEEFPSLSFMAPDEHAALRGIKELVDLAVEDWTIEPECPEEPQSLESQNAGRGGP